MITKMNTIKMKIKI